MKLRQQCITSFLLCSQSQADAGTLPFLPFSIWKVIAELTPPIPPSTQGRGALFVQSILHDQLDWDDSWSVPSDACSENDFAGFDFDEEMLHLFDDDLESFGPALHVVHSMQRDMMRQQFEAAFDHERAS
jgi:hypothetical protein